MHEHKLMALHKVVLLSDTIGSDWLIKLTVLKSCPISWITESSADQPQAKANGWREDEHDHDESLHFDAILPI